MFSKLMQVLLVATSISPVLLTFWFNEFSKSWDIRAGIGFLLVAIILVGLLWFLIKIAKSKLESIPLKISTVSNADSESIVFIFSYILPLIDIDRSMVIFLLIMFFLIVFTTNIYHFNPVLGLLGYHHYEITIDGGVSYILLTKKTLRNSKQVNSVVQLSNYIILEKE